MVSVNQEPNLVVVGCSTLNIRTISSGKIETPYADELYSPGLEGNNGVGFCMETMREQGTQVCIDLTIK
jgi:hypothetical protein